MKAEKRKDHILKCAKKRFSKYGFYRTQISDIILDAKIARGTIYQYFENKEAIFISLLEKTYGQWEKSVLKAVEEMDLNTIHPVEYVRLRIKTTLEFLLSDPDICNIVMGMGFGLPDDLEDTTKKLEKKIKSIAVNDFMLGIHSKNVRSDINVELTAEMVAAAIFRSAHYTLEKMKHNNQKADIDAVTEEIIALFAPGLFGYCDFPSGKTGG